MKTATLFFANGEELIVTEKQIFMAVTEKINAINEDYIPTESKEYMLWVHVNEGLMPSILELLFNSDFFYALDNPRTLYNTSSVVKVTE